MNNDNKCIKNDKNLKQNQKSRTLCNEEEEEILLEILVDLKEQFEKNKSDESLYNSIVKIQDILKL